MTIRPLHTIPEFREVLALETGIWGYADPEDAVGVPVFVATLKRGGILLGACDGDRLVGFVYSIAGLKDGRPTQWSHMLAVRPEYRGAGIGRALKIEQRRISLAMGLDLMEWTFDPLVAANAYLNIRRLGAGASEYSVDVYGESPSPLHKGAPTDRLIAQWWMRSPRVEEALARPAPPPAPAAGTFPDAARANTVAMRGSWPACEAYDLARTDANLAVTIPGAFTDILSRDSALAFEWRMATREIFTGYLAKGYEIADFAFDAGGNGTYLLRSGAAVA